MMGQEMGGDSLSPVEGVDPIRVMRVIARLNVGGPAVHVSLLTAGLNDAEFQSLLVAGQIGEAEGDMGYLARQMGVEPVIIPSLQREISPLADLRALRALIRLMREVRPQIVHTHTAKAGLVGRLAARLTRVPVVIHTFHGHVFHGYFGRIKTQLFLTLERLSAHWTDVVLTVSERLREELIAYRIAPAEKIGVVPLGLPLDQFADLDDERGTLRSELGYSTDTPLVGMIGRLVPIKRHELFLEAARIIAAENPQARFLIVGDGERRAEMEEMAADLGLADAVRFTGWRADLPAIYADLDVVVIASRNEGTPVSIIEAMAAGVPVVSTAVGGVPDLLCEGRFGELVEPEDAAALAGGIRKALRSGKSDQRVDMARQWAYEQYGGARLIDDIRTLYRELLDRKAADQPVRTRQAKRQDG
jgi:glycosyltransferase involved in cell wall biosynthesis